MKYDVVKIKITNRCNRKCKFCVFNNNDKELTFEEYKKMIEKVKKINFQKFHINGGEPLIHKDFMEMIEYSKNVLKDKIFVLGTNTVLLKNNYKLLEFVKYNFDEICIGCDLEHRNIEILKEVVPKLCENEKITIVINSIIEYSSQELLNELQKMKDKYKNIVLVRNHVYHKCEGETINNLEKGLCDQKKKRFLLIQENGDTYRCFNCCVPEDKETNIYDEDFYEKIDKERTKHYKFCAWCTNYEP